LAAGPTNAVLRGDADTLIVRSPAKVIRELTRTD
jgi:hypothetical protein